VNAPRLALIGTGGHGRTHVEKGLTLHAEGRAQLVAVADPFPPAAEDLPEGVARFTDGADLIAAGGVDIVVICTPINTHFDFASAALEAGADVMLEKPTTATLDEFERLLAVADRTGGLVQVGFQSLGSDALDIIRGRVAAGDIGEVVRYSATGAWLRNEAYYARSPWAGRRMLAGRVVADGALTNPLAHASATALALAGSTRLEDVVSLELDLWRANDIEADDTSVAVFDLAGDVRLTTAVTLAAPVSKRPYVDVVGTNGTLRLWYTSDDIELRNPNDEVLESFHVGRRDLIANLRAARDGSEALFSPLAETGAFMRLVEGVMQSPAPRRVAEGSATLVDDENGRHMVIDGIEEELERALRLESTFTELDSAFTRVR
jgi:predicted dehydrogenase